MDEPAHHHVRKGTGSFLHSFVFLAGGAVFGQAIGFLFTPILSRLFAPDAYGTFSVFRTIVSLVCVIACLRYQLAILLPEKDEDAAHLFMLCGMLGTATTGVVCIAVWLLGSTGLSTLVGQDVFTHRWLLPVAVLVEGISLPLQYWAMRSRRFQMLAIRQVLAAAVIPLASLVAAELGYRTGTVLIVAGILGGFATVVALACPVLGSEGKYLAMRFSIKGSYRLALRYIRFPLIESWSAFFQVISTNVSVLMMAAAFGKTTVGLYSKSVVLLLLPLNMIGNSVAQVLFQRGAEKRATGQDLAGMVEQVLKRLIGVSLLPALVIALIGPDLFSVFCGQKWTEAGVYARILSPWLLLVAVASPLSVLFSITERLGRGLAFNALLVVGRIGALAAGGWCLCDARWTVFLFMAIGAGVNMWMLCYLLGLVGVNRWRLSRYVGLCLLVCVPTITAASVTKWWVEAPSMCVISVTALASTSYWFPLLYKDVILWAAIVKSGEKLGNLLGFTALRS
jgi:O-antigen/teichoic acid export membrane protein